jgi:hypothetical protein
MSASRFYKRFPVSRRRACVLVTSTRTDEAERSQQTRAAGQANGEGTVPQGSGPAPVDLKSRGSKE